VSHKIYRVHDNNIQLILWDLAGQAKFHVMRSAFYHGAKAVLLVFDLTNPASFLSIKNWYNDIMRHSDLKENLIGFVLGNKNDLVSERAVSLIEANQLASTLQLGYFETSALTGENVDGSFNNLAEALLTSARKY
jgi:small GTP-binding protein